MRHFLILILASVILSCSEKPKSKFNPLTEREDILKVLSKQQDDWNNGDIVGFMDGYWKSDSLTFSGSKGISAGWDATLAGYKKTYPSSYNMGKLSFEVISINFMGNNIAHMLGKFEIISELGRPTGYFTLMWRKFDKKWLIVADHTCG